MWGLARPTYRSSISSTKTLRRLQPFSRPALLAIPSLVRRHHTDLESTQNETLVGNPTQNITWYVLAASDAVNEYS
jgi:hypothetical protein